MALHVGQVKETAARHQRRGDPLAHFVITILGQRRADDRTAGVGNVGEVGAGVLATTFAVAVEDPERRPLPAHEAPAKWRDETGECVNARLLILPPEPAMLRQAEQIDKQPAQCLAVTHAADLGRVWIEPCAEAFIISRFGINDFAVVGEVGDRHIQHAGNQRQVGGEESTHQGDACVLLTHALGHKDLISRVVFLEDSGFHGSFHGGDQLRGLDG